MIAYRLVSQGTEVFAKKLGRPLLIGLRHKIQRWLLLILVSLTPLILVSLAPLAKQVRHDICALITGVV